ncbi:hypothetical protein MJ390_12500 [Klebsiella pneumoniae]|nr:hypothetical protein MJ390_12500 [Klebsiella pneumoniae]
MDEVLDYLQLAPEKRQQVQRCLINDLNPQAVRAGDQPSARQQRVRAALRVGALARARADWLYGINMTRATTPAGGGATPAIPGGALGGAGADPGTWPGGPSR